MTKFDEMQQADSFKQKLVKVMARISKAWQPSNTKTVRPRANPVEEARNRDRERNDRENGSRRANSHSGRSTANTDESHEKND